MTHETKEKITDLLFGVMSKADKLFQMVDTLVNCIEHREVAGEGVAEFWVKEAKKLMEEVRGV